MYKKRILAMIWVMALICSLMPIVSVWGQETAEVVSTGVKYTYAGIYEPTGEILIRAEASLIYGGEETEEETTTETTMNSFVYSGQKWQKSDLPVSYRIDEDGDNGDPASEFVSVPAGAQTWEDDYASDMDFTYAGTSSGISAPAHDGNNIIIWEPVDGPGGNLATTTWWFTLPNGWIVEFDMRFDDDETWVDGDPPGFDIDLETVAFHEFGHTLSLGHDSNPNAVMYWSYQGIRRDLYYTDTMGIRYIYPGPGKPHPDQNRLEDPWYPVYIMLGDIKAEMMELLPDIKSEIEDIEDKLDLWLPDIKNEIVMIEDKLDFWLPEIKSEIEDIEWKLDYMIDKEAVEVEILTGKQVGVGTQILKNKFVYYMMTTVAGEKCSMDLIEIEAEDVTLDPADYTYAELKPGVYRIEINRGAISPGTKLIVIQVQYSPIAGVVYHGAAITTAFNVGG